MAEPAGLGQLNSGDWERLQDLADRFEKACQEGGGQTVTVSLQEFLPPPGTPLRSVALQELITVELEVRARRGQPVGLEFYLEQFPEMGSAQDLPAEFIYEEYRTRHLFGDSPPLASYQKRFPDQFQRLQQLVTERPLPARLTDTINPLPSTKTPPQVTDTIDPLPTTHVPPQQTTSPDTTHVVRVVGDYQLTRCLGRGTFGEVWQGRAPGGVEVAVKIITQPVDDETAKRELQALELTKQLRHPFLLQVHRYWQEGNRLYIAMELAEGSLRDRLKECRKAGLPGVPAEELLQYFKESADALDFLHKQHVLHRDVKPDNLLLIQQHAKVADFGLVREQQIQGLFSASCSGTPAYMAPEIWAGKVSEHSDQYGLAITYAELRLGRWPFANMAEAMLGNPPNLDPLPSDEQKVILKALASDTKQRHASCRQFVQALERTLIKEPLAPTPLSKKVAFLAAAMFLVLGLLAGAWIFKAMFASPTPTTPATPERSVLLLSGCVPIDQDTHTDLNGKEYYRRIERVMDNSDRIPFVLVPKETRDDPQTFYIMVNKVSVGQFRKFAAERPELVTGNDWNKGTGDDYPVQGVAVTDAHHFAADYMKGNLPRHYQWEKAAGFHDWQRKKLSSGPGYGPFKGKWSDGSKLKIAINRAAAGPMKVGVAEDDESLFGCRDMAGNGREWTRTLKNRSKTFPLAEPGSDDFVELRGQNYDAPEPFQFQMLLGDDGASWPYTKTLPDLGFRVVLEP